MYKSCFYIKLTYHRKPRSWSSIGTLMRSTRHRHSCCIHPASMCSGPHALLRFFVRAAATRASTTRPVPRNCLQIAEWSRGRNLEIMRRSAFGMIRVYNLLPQDVVEKMDAKSFRSTLTQMVRDTLNGGDLTWRFLLSPRHQLFNTHPLRI